MNKTKTIILLSLLLLSFACKKEETKAAATVIPTKDLFSADWTLTPTPSWSLDIRLGNLVSGNFNMYANYVGGYQCACATNINGTQSSGSIQTTCNASIPGGGIDNTSCQAVFNFGGTATYTNTAATLRICKTGTTNCFDYR